MSDAGKIMNEPEAAIEGSEEDRPGFEIACINQRTMRAALVSTDGNHCQVWRSTRKSCRNNEDGNYFEYVIKYPVDRYTHGDARVLMQHYHQLRDALGEIVPEALFVEARINGVPNLFVLARAINIWFNIANPVNREEAIGLLRDNHLARTQLQRFVDQAKRWREGPNPRIIDLFGLDNLVMDNQRRIRFIDSFYVFFFEDLLHMLGGEPDPELEEKISTSLQRLDYLQDILTVSEPQN